MHSYKTLQKTGNSVEIVNKSKFIALAMPIQNEQEAFEVIKGQKSLYPDATHHCYGFILGIDSDSVRYSDAGEPSGTAGMPILSVLRKHSLTNSIVVVTRYFGGTLLGAGGLIRAYSSTSALAIQDAIITIMLPSINLLIKCDYSCFARLEHYFKTNDTIAIKDIAYIDLVNMQCLVPLTEKNNIIETITNLTDGKGNITEQENEYYPWKTKE